LRSIRFATEEKRPGSGRSAACALRLYVPSPAGASRHPESRRIDIDLLRAIAVLAVVLFYFDLRIDQNDAQRAVKGDSDCAILQS